MKGLEGCKDFDSSLLLAINEASPDGILVVDRLNEIVSVNSRFFSVWGIPRSTLNSKEILHSSDTPILEQVLSRVIDPAKFLLRVRQLYTNPDLEDKCEIELNDGRTLERHSTALKADNGCYLGRVWYFRDISSHKLLEKELRDLATTDSLTGIANRRYFFERAHEEFMRFKRQQSPLSVIMLDIDNFKKVNDNWGHDIGDIVLQVASTTWQKTLRAQDLLARIGGEEFAVLLPDTRLEAAFDAAKRLEHALLYQSNDTLLKDGICFTASAGVAMLRDHDSRFDDCLRRADIALYRAKAAGRNRIELE